MRTSLLLFAAVAAAFGQQAPRTLSFQQLQAPNEIAEAATVIRSIGEIRELSVDAPARTLTLRGNPEQLKLADWLITRIDRAGGRPPAGAESMQFQMEKGGAATVRILYFQNTDSPRDRNELATVVRSLVEVPSAFTAQPAAALVVRGAQPVVEAAQWAFETLDRRPGDAAGMAQFSMGADDTIRVVSVPKAAADSLEQFYRLATDARKDAKMRRMYVFSPLRLVALRGTQSEIEAAITRLSAQ